MTGRQGKTLGSAVGAHETRVATPPRARPLVLCADDYAFSAGVSAGVRALARQGRLGATSVMVLSPRWLDDAPPLAELRDRIDVGLHLDWTSPFAVAAGHGVGLPAAMARARLGGFDRAAAERVIEDQLDRFERAWGAAPDHVDGHQHVHQFNGIRQALVAVLARRYPWRAPWMRISRVPPDAATFKTRVIAAWGAAALERSARAAGLPCAPALTGVYGFDGEPGTYAGRMAGWLRGAPAGCVLLCHPAAAAAEEAPWPDAIATARRREFDYLASADFGRLLRALGIRIERGSALFGDPQRLNAQ